MDAIIDKYGFKEGLTTKEGKIINWPYSEKKPTITELKVIVADYKAAIAYKEARIKDYPPIEEQLDMIYKDKINNTSKWEELITQIKIKHPKQ